jgi:predicted permease
MAASYLDSLTQDLRYTIRTLRRDAGFAAFAILIVGLGIGASSTLFSVVNTLLLRPLPFRDPERLAWITNHDTGGLSGATTQVAYLIDLRQRAQSYTDLAGYFAFYGVGDSLLIGSGEPERLSAVPVSENFFQTLDVEPQLGRLFNSEECKWHGPKAALLSHGLWERRFASDPGIVGRTLQFDDGPVTVVGVLPATFDFGTVFAAGAHFDLFVPFPLSAETNRWGNTMAIIARLKPGVSPSAADAEMRVLGPQLSSEHRNDRNDFLGKVAPLAEHVSGRFRLALWVLTGAVAVVMLIVCANLSNLLLARTAARQKEIAVRTALGAGRGRLLLQMLTEGLTLSGCGALLGIVLAIAGTRGVAHLEAVSIPLLANVRLDALTLGFTLLMAMATGVVFGLAPAIQVSAAALHDVLKDANRGSTQGRRQWVRGALVISEIAFACVLLVGAGLLIRSFARLLDVDLGFRPEHAASVRVDPDPSYKTEAQQNAYFDEVLRLIRTVPGIQSAGLTDVLPLGRNRSWGAGEKGAVYPKGSYPNAFVRVVTDGYFGAMGIPVRAGRDFTARDTTGSDPVIVINETMARRLFAGRDPLGKTIRACGERHVIGVVGDVRHLSLEENSGLEMYLPMRQCHDQSSVDLVVRTTLPPSALPAAVRGALRPVQPNISGNAFRTLQQLVDKSVSPRRFVVLMLGGFALFALVLASLGIYGVISYSVNQRTQEIGIRMALGAQAGRVQAGILMQTLGLAAIGMALGGAASWVLARSLKGMLFSVTAGDPLTFAGMVAVLTMVAAIAGYLPARRASRIDPSVALRAS